MKSKVIRTSTVSMSLEKLLEGQLEYFNEFYTIIAVSGNDAYLSLVSLREKVRTEKVTMYRTISPLRDLVSLWMLFVLFKKENPLIVHSITPKAGLLSMIAGCLAGVPIRIHTFTGLIFPSKRGLFQKLLILMDKLLCACATTIYPEGEGVKNDLLRYNITSKPLKVIANGNVNGINTTYFNPELYDSKENEALKSKLNIKESDCVFIFVGRIVGDKGINELVKAFDQLSKENRTIKLLMVGPLEEDLDPLETQTQSIISSHDQIISVGYQNDVRPYFAIADVLVFPSYREGFPNVVMQAGAMGLPSIVTNINGCNEIIKDEENGLIIPVKNSEAIYKAMKKLLEDTELKNKLQQNARNRITELYEQKIVWEALLNEYKRLENNV